MGDVKAKSFEDLSKELSDKLSKLGKAKEAQAVAVAKLADAQSERIDADQKVRAAQSDVEEAHRTVKAHIEGAIGVKHGE